MPKGPERLLKTVSLVTDLPLKIQP